MQQRMTRRRAWILGLALVATSAAGVGTVIASDHQDTPLVELNPRMDMTDVYAFPGSAPDRIVLVMNTSAFLTPGQTPTAGFDPSILYQFKIDNNGDAREDKVIQVTFQGEGANQKVQVVGPVAPPVQGAMMNTLVTSGSAVTGATRANLGSASGIQAFAGPRDDSFFLDLEQFFRVIPDRKPASGPLSQLPDTATASAFRAPGAAVNYLVGFNTLSIVVELPTSLLTQGGTPKLGIWGTISR